jgi:biotin transport system substrate-specific component
MSVTANANAIERLTLAKQRAYTWRLELSIAKKLTLALTLAAVIGLMAQARIILPWTPVPITLQTMGVLLAAMLLGRNWGAVSVGLYLALGIAGVPWFIGSGSGMAHLAGPTGGYLVGFVLAALFLGYFTDKYVAARRLGPLFALMLFAGLVLVYVPGVLQLKLWMGQVLGNQISWGQALNMGVLPFIAGDLLKVAAASGLGYVLATRRPFGSEADRK